MTVSLMQNLTLKHDSNEKRNLTILKQLLTRLAFLVHAITALLIAFDPFLAFQQLSGRPKMIHFAVRANGVKQGEMLYAYERIAAAFQCFVGMGGLFIGVDNWYMPLALMVYDILNVIALNRYL